MNFNIIRYEYGRDWDDNIISCFIAVNVEFEGEIMISEKWLTSDELATVVADENSITQIIEDIVAKAITILEKQKYTKARLPLIKDISTVVLPSEENIITKSSEYKDEFMGLIGQLVEKGTVVWYQGKLYRCIQSHITQLDWEPDREPALWGKVGGEEIIEWYADIWMVIQVGELVQWQGKVYQCVNPTFAWIEPGTPDAYNGWTYVRDV